MQAAWITEHSDYVYLGAKLTNSAPAKFVLAHERIELANRRGVNVLFADLSLGSLEVDELLSMIEEQEAVLDAAK